jgi:uncharacterized membrane protein
MELVEDFRHQKKYVINHIKRMGIEKASEYASLTGIPVIAVWTYIHEEFPKYRQMAKNRIESIKEFYKYEEE